MRFSLLCTTFAAVALASIVTGCDAGVGADDGVGGAGGETAGSEDALTSEACARPAGRNERRCATTAVVEGGFIGEIDPFVVGEACVLFVRDFVTGKATGLVEDYDVCTATRAFDGKPGALVRFHRGDLAKITKPEVLRALEDYRDDASYYDLRGAVSAVSPPPGSLRLECSVADPCAHASTGSLGACVKKVTLQQVTDADASLVVEYSHSAAGASVPGLELVRTSEHFEVKADGEVTMSTEVGDTWLSVKPAGSNRLTGTMAIEEDFGFEATCVALR